MGGYLAPNVYNDCSIRGAFLLLSNILDTKGEGVWEGVSPPPPTTGTFLDFGVLKPGFWCVIRFKLTSTRAPNVYDCSIRWAFLLFLLRIGHQGDVLDFGVIKPGFCGL